MNETNNLSNVSKMDSYETNFTGLGILKAMAIVQSELAKKGISKSRDTNSTNQKFNYKFRGIEDMYNAISPLLAENGIIIVPEVLKTNESDKVSDDGKVTHRVSVHVRYTFVCVNDGSTFTASVVGEASDQGDKATSKAMSVAQKYLFIQTFAIPTYDSISKPQNSTQSNRNYNQNKHSNGNQNRSQNNQNNNSYRHNEKPTKAMLDNFTGALNGVGISVERFLKKRNLTSLSQMTMQMLINESNALEKYLHTTTHQRRA